MMRIRSIAEPHTTDLARRLRDASAPEKGVVVARVPPGLRRGHDLSHEILAGLGVRDDVTGAGRDDRINWEVLAAWLVAWPVDHLVVLDAQWLPPHILTEVALLAAATTSDLWLIADLPVGEKYLDALSQWPHTESDLAELQELLEDRRPEQRRRAGPEFPTVPSSNFTTFRAECRDQLGSGQAARVDDRYRTAHTEAERFLATGEGLSEANLFAALRAQLQSCGDASEMMTVIRAYQAAAFLAGWLVQADLPALLAALDGAPQAVVAAPDTWRRLRAYREPYRAAACALAARDVGANEMAELQCGAVSADGSRISVVRAGSSVSLEVPPGGEVFVRAQSALRSHQGAGPSDRYFANDNGPMRPRHLANAVRAPATELGVALFSGQLSWRRGDDKRWAARYGLSVQAL